MKLLFAVPAILLLLLGCSHDASPPTVPGSPAASSAPTQDESAQTSTATPSATAPASAPVVATATMGTTPGQSLAVGDLAPDFTTTASDGTSLHIRALKGRSVVVYFYPKDETEGCTKEACAFRDAWTTLSKMNLVLIGVSGDTDDSHRAFQDNHKLPFHLVSDKDGAIAALYGVPFQNGFAARQSFVIGPDGNVKKIYRHVDVTMHAAEIARDVKP